LPLKLDEALAAHAHVAAPIGSALRGASIVGVSYIGFKLIHFAVDYREGAIENVTPLEFLSWLLFFPSIVAGPMQRFQDWQAQRAQAQVTLPMAVRGLQRLLGGMVLKFVLADSIHGASLATMSNGTLATATFWQLAAAAVCYTLYLYWDFAGYSSMAIGIGMFWGITLPENFRNPFFARNLAEFWNRWHISLSLILRDYLFYPFSLWEKRRPFFKRHPNLAAALPPLVTFLIAGIWHGAAIGYLVHGLLHGLGLGYLAVRKRSRTRSRLASWWLQSRIGHVCGAAVNFCYVTFSLVFFCLSNDRLALLWHRFVP
jgi:D-alanyl-lipoteichoic acid acyltransferase DltB (MBOAT superfamily)